MEEHLAGTRQVGSSFNIPGGISASDPPRNGHFGRVLSADYITSSADQKGGAWAVGVAAGDGGLNIDDSRRLPQLC